jgi:multimeric flavodoxin WrbA
VKVVVIDASARADGLTARMSKAAAAGAEQGGAEVRWISLQPLRIERCRMCNPDGWGDCRKKGTCVIEDDFAALAQQLREADRFILATPVYFGDLSESARAFTDRLRRIGTCPDNRAFLDNLPTLGIATAGGGGGGTPSCMASIEKALTTPGCFVVDMIPVARRNQSYKAQVMQIAGRALAGPPQDTWPARKNQKP